MCLTWCFFSSDGVGAAYPQPGKSHTVDGLIPWTDRSWVCRPYLLVNLLLHITHRKGCSSEMYENTTKSLTKLKMSKNKHTLTWRKSRAWSPSRDRLSLGSRSVEGAGFGGVAFTMTTTTKTTCIWLHKFTPFLPRGLKRQEHESNAWHNATR